MFFLFEKFFICVCRFVIWFDIDWIVDRLLMLLNNVFVLMFVEFLNDVDELELCCDDVLKWILLGILVLVDVDVDGIIFGKLENKIIFFVFWFCGFFSFLFGGNIFLLILFLESLKLCVMLFFCG